jgi:hypothetical protein
MLRNISVNDPMSVRCHLLEIVAPNTFVTWADAPQIAIGYAPDVARPGLAGLAGWEAARRAPCRDAAHRHSRDHRASDGTATSCAATGRAGRARAGPAAWRGTVMFGRSCCAWHGRTRHGAIAGIDPVPRSQAQGILALDFQRRPTELPRRSAI